MLNNFGDTGGAALARLGTGVAILSGFPLMFAGLKVALDGAAPAWVARRGRRAATHVALLAAVGAAAATASEDDVGLIIELLGSTLGVAAVYVVGDYMMNCPNRRVAHVLAEHGRAPQVYLFAEPPGSNKTRGGVYHGAELRFVFYDLDELVYGPDAGKDERKLARSMVCYWSAHAYGEAAHHCGCDWPRFTAHNNGTNLKLGLHAPKIERGFRNTECDAWDVIESGPF